MRQKKLKISLLIIFITLSVQFVVFGTVEYAEQTDKDCADCHVDPDGGDKLNTEGLNFADQLKKKGLLRAPFQGEKTLTILLGYVHIMTAFIWFGAILYIHLFLKPAYISKGIPKGELKLGWISMIIMLLTGIYLMWRKIPTLDSLFHTRFGNLLLIKLGLFVFMILTIFFVTFVLASKLGKISEDLFDLDKKDLTIEELAHFNGKEGRPAFTSLSGNIYNVTNSKLWKDGIHFKKHISGVDLTNALKQAPHNAEIVEKMPLIGKTVEGSKIHKRPFYDKLFYFLAYSMLIVIFSMIFIISIWK